LPLTKLLGCVTGLLDAHATCCILLLRVVPGSTRSSDGSQRSPLKPSAEGASARSNTSLRRSKLTSLSTITSRNHFVGRHRQQHLRENHRFDDWSDETFRREIIALRVAAPAHTVPYGTVLSRDAFPGTSCLATIVLSLRDKNHSPSRKSWQPPYSTTPELLSPSHPRNNPFNRLDRRLFRVDIVRDLFATAHHDNAVHDLKDVVNIMSDKDARMP